MAPKVSEQHRAQRRTQILDSAIQCFSDKGYETTTVDDIVREAGISKGMVYTYFKSKEEIFLAIVNDRTNQFMHQLEESLHSRNTAWEKLRYVLERHSHQPLTREAKRWNAVYLEFFLSSSRDESRQTFMHQRYQQYLKVLVDVINEGKKSGEFRDDVNATSMAALYWALCDGLDLHASQLSDVMNTDELYQDAIDVVRRKVVRNI
jgi:AcrR family transcriptional regulator